MLQCDFCRKRINPRDQHRVMVSKQHQIHLHDEQEPDCADLWTEQARAIQGERPTTTQGGR